MPRSFQLKAHDLSGGLRISADEPGVNCSQFLALDIPDEFLAQIVQVALTRVAQQGKITEELRGTIMAVASHVG